MTGVPSQPRIMVIVPALSREEGAIAGVIRSVNQSLPGVPVLVIDDQSEDATASLAEQAGAQVLRLPVHLGLGGCVQAGYKLAFEMAFRLCGSGGWRRST